MSDLEHDASQKQAIELICGPDRVAVVTGGPGTGKTTTLKAALNDFRLNTKKVALVAPTGKAAKRLAQVVGREAGTVHKLIGYDGEHYSTEMLNVDIVICDEASMLDVEMAYALTRVLPATAKLRLIGDADQLPSVGAGSLLRDVIESETVPVAKLRTLHRAAAQSWVCLNAPKILDGEMFDTETADDFEAFEADRVHEVIDLVKMLVRQNVKALYDGNFQFLTPMNLGDLGTEVLNQSVADMLNVARQHEDNMFELAVPKATMQHFAAVGDRVIHVTNNYQLGVLNGEIGVIDRYDKAGARVAVRFTDRVVFYPIMTAMHQLRLAYALTIHKSQGSEWDTVLVLCHGAHLRMWSRQLLYTAVTRAKKKVLIVGNDTGIGIALAQNRPRERFTTLPFRIQEHADRRTGLMKARVQKVAELMKQGLVKLG